MSAQSILARVVNEASETALALVKVLPLSKSPFREILCRLGCVKLV